jgi:hypothetical protein
MSRWRKCPIVTLLLILFLVTTVGAPALAEEYEEGSEVTAASMIGDFLVLRPLGFAATVVGTVFAVITTPFTHAAGQDELAKEKLIQEPADFTFKRPLGKLPD